MTLHLFRLSPSPAPGSAAMAGSTHHGPCMVAASREGLGRLFASCAFAIAISRSDAGAMQGLWTSAAVSAEDLGEAPAGWREGEVQALSAGVWIPAEEAPWHPRTR